MARQSSDEDEGGSVILATLKRGKSYKHQFEGKYYGFKRNEPEQVSEGLADELEQLVDRIQTEDDDVIEKDYFEINRDASPRTVNPETKRKRLRIVSEEVDDVPVRKKPKLRTPPAKRETQTGFGKRSASAR